MIWSKSLVPTLREDPRQAENVSHKILLRAGFVRPLASGLYNYLPFGLKVCQKVTQIIREEMNRIGGQEMHLSALSPRSMWERSGRWNAFGDDMFRLKDRKQQDLALCPTHEEVMALIASKELRSYKELPQIWYQFQTKFRDEPRPRGGVLRTRQFTMKDSYSFDLDYEGLDASFKLHSEAYSRMFSRMGHDFFIVQASGGLMGAGESHEFMVEASSGEDISLVCPECDYRANAEVAEGRPVSSPALDSKKEKIHTPGLKTVEEVSGFLGVKPSQLVKSILFVKDGKPLLVLVRGDYDFSEEKLKRAFGTGLEPAENEDAEKHMGASLGFLGPQGVDIDIYADISLETADIFAAGANEDDYHILGISLSDDANIKEYMDLRTVRAGDGCPNCKGSLQEKRTIELGHIFKLGTKYSEAMGANVLDAEGKEHPIVMGSYGIGVERSMAALIDRYYKNDVMAWPVAVAPYEVQIVSLGENEVSGRFYKELASDGLDVALDDRDMAPGAKFADADLIGIPYRIVVGPRGLKQGKVDIRKLATDETINVAVDDVVTKVSQMISAEKD
ncbi:proline--tRNA ligase [candidate division WOR-3 bacterium]|uniref:Proline--tRNA ligase n=1 Tax=candidate division WOR-3 bacterium TaxID=2052148 RepID=A0A9D5K8B9_UNCW3|nr:proline--tRNA ligase [candidate division WOR-3 bacterium]MBD3364010.1 proline--tRNA ligase [candidate division WOR-3 bacterium]